MVAFIDAHRVAYGVEPICDMRPIAPSTYCEAKTRQADPRRLSARTRRDEYVRDEVARVWRANRRVYGVRKVRRQLAREGVLVARCTVARLMRAEGLRDVVRGARVRTTMPDAAADRPRDLVEREFVASRPNQLWVGGRFVLSASCALAIERPSPAQSSVRPRSSCIITREAAQDAAVWK